MGVHSVLLTALFFFSLTQATAETTDWRLNALLPVLPDDRERIGRLVCGEGGFETTEDGLRCKICPAYTSDQGSKEGLTIQSAMQGRFSGAGVKPEWLIDTEGCEAHYANFGGAILLTQTVPKTLRGTPAVALGSSLIAKPDGGGQTMAFYRPGYRVNDCMPWITKDERNLVICNEADTAQGEVIGHISVMEITRRGIIRWRLVRWYDNSAGEASRVLSVVPSGMRRVELDDGQPGLQIKLKILELPREAYENDRLPAREPVSLMFRNKGQRFFAVKKTQSQLNEISASIRKMLE